MYSRSTGALLLFVAIALGIAACDSGGGMDSEPEPDPEPGDVEATVEGTVTDAGSSDPIDGADVTVLRADEGEELGQSTTGSSGNYEVSFTVPENDTPDQLALEAEAEGFMAKTDTVSFEESLTQDITLEAASMEATASGEVTDEESGEGIEGASVTGTSSDGTVLFEDTTDASGMYQRTFEVADEPDEVTIMAEAEDFESDDQALTFSKEITADFQLSPTTTEATASGTVTNGDTGDPIEGATVTGSSESSDMLFETTTDANGEYQGTFEVSDKPEEVTITAEAESFESGQQTVNFSEEITADFQLSPTTTEATASGTVTNGDTGDPIEGATITGSSESGDMLFEATTDANGEYQETFEVADEPDEVTITADEEDFEAADTTVSFVEEITADFQLSPETTEATASGTVTDEETDDPIEGATITGTSGSGDTLFEDTTDASGEYQKTYEVKVIDQPEEVTVSAEAQDYNSATQTVDFTEQLETNFALAPETVDVLVEGSVTATGDGSPIDGATIEAFRASQDEDRLGQSTSESDGSYQLSFTLDAPRTPDELRIKATADSFEVKEATASFASSIDQDFELTQNRFSLNLSVDGEGSIDTSLLSGDLNENGYLLGSEVEVEVLPDSSNVFFGWEGDIESSSNPVTVEVTENIEAAAEVGSPQEGLSLGISFVQIGSTINEATLFLSNNLPEDVVVTGFTLFDENDSEVVSTSGESLTIAPDDSGGFDIDFGLDAPTPEELEQFETVWEFEFRGDTFVKEVVVGDVLSLTNSSNVSGSDANMIELKVEE